MSLKNHTLEILPGKPFDNCKLERKKYSDVLTNIVSNYEDGFVMAINNKWGTGKTTFVKMWRQDLNDQNFQTVYFNAWENDFEDNPLTALMGELKTLTNQDTAPKFQKALKNAASLSKHIAPAIAQALVDKYVVDTNNIKDVIVSATKGIADVFENDVNNYEKKKLGIKEFRESLSKFIADTNEGKPIIFIIDELDRCRPNYAVSILEQIKHFFSVPNIVFVLSIDKNQLGNAIRGVYGSDRIDSNEYLRRFIDVEYSIPKPPDDLFYKYLFEKLDFKEFFESEERRKYPELVDDKDRFLSTCKLLFNNSNIALRQQERILILSRLSLRSFEYNNYLFPSIYLLLNYLKILHNEFYQEIKDKKLLLQEIQERLFEIIKDSVNDRNRRELMFSEAFLLMFYNNYKYEHHNRQELYDKGGSFDDKDKKLNINSMFGSAYDQELLTVILNIERGFYRATSLSLKHFIDKIELLEPINI